MTNRTSIRLACEDDLKAIAEIQVQLWHETYTNIVPVRAKYHFL